MNVKKFVILIAVTALLVSSLACNAATKFTHPELSPFQYLDMTLQVSKAYTTTEFMVGIMPYHPERGDIFLMIDYKASGELQRSSETEDEAFPLTDGNQNIHYWRGVLFDQTIGEVSMVYNIPWNTDLSKVILTLPNGTLVHISSILGPTQ